MLSGIPVEEGPRGRFISFSLSSYSPIAARQREGDGLSRYKSRRRTMACSPCVSHVLASEVTER
jgi:hypothetical protein